MTKVMVLVGIRRGCGVCVQKWFGDWVDVIKKLRSLHGLPVSLKLKHVVFNCYDRACYFN